MKFIVASLIALCLCMLATSTAAAQPGSRMPADLSELLEKFHEMGNLLNENRGVIDEKCEDSDGSVLPTTDPAAQCLNGQNEVYTAWFDKNGTIAEVSIDDFAPATLKNLKQFYKKPAQIVKTKTTTEYTWRASDCRVVLLVWKDGTTRFSVVSLTAQR